MDLIKMAKRKLNFKTLPSEFLYTILQQKDISQKQGAIVREKQILTYESIKDIMTMPNGKEEK